MPDGAVTTFAIMTIIEIVLAAWCTKEIINGIKEKREEKRRARKWVQ